MKNALAVASENPQKMDMAERGELDRIEVKPAENGCIVTGFYSPKKPKKGDLLMGWPEPEVRVFESGEAAAAFVTTLLKQQEAYEKKEGK